MHCKYGHEKPIKFFDEKGDEREYKCDKEVVEDGYCCFHHPTYWKKDPERVREELYQEVDGSLKQNEELLCIGYNLPEVNFGDIRGQQLFFTSAVYFDYANFHKEAHFIHLEFPYSSFDNTTFTDVTFNSAKLFTAIFEKAHFKHAKFLGVESSEAEFNNTIFESVIFDGSGFNNVSFNNARFNGNTGFRKISFGRANFKKAEFKSICYFRANFDLAIFNEATFEVTDFSNSIFGDAEFDNVKFNDTAEFSGTTFNKASFSNTTFEDIAVFDEAKFNLTYLTNAIFNNGADFFKAKFVFTNFLDVEFKSSNFQFSANFELSEFTSTVFSKTIFESASYRKAKLLEDVNFIETDLSKVSFIKANIENANFIDVTWNSEGILFPRKAVFDEKKRENREYELIAEVYRRLRLNYESKLQHPFAGDFYIGEMEMSRKNVKTEEPFSRFLFENFSLIAFYRYFSLYGENYWLPLMWMFLIIIPIFSFAFFYFYSLDFVSSIETSILSFFQFPPSENKIQIPQLILLLERLFGLTFVGLFILALRRRFKKAGD